ncbi:MAG: FAD-dependent oxidoreductase [Candidatus Omnitrophica bacterium]|nr:FAD-dependent oxidoreductase [Candidatus Omnitrophota bacterium]
MKKSKTLIIGAGLAGLSASFFLKRDYQIFEKETTPGGLCRSRHFNGYTFDYDGHLLHFRDKDILNLVQKLMGGNLICTRRDSWINSFGCYTRYPFQANLFGLPKNVIKECVLGFIDAQLNGNVNKYNQTNFKQWTLRTFGPGIARHFMLPYNNKFWTIPAHRLTREWVDGYIPIPSIKDVLGGTIAQSKKRFGYNAQFWYPRKGGIENLIFALRRRIKNNIHTLHQVAEIDLKTRTVTFCNGRKARFINLISTLPLPEMLKLIPHLPPKIKAALSKLKYTSVFCLNLGVARGNISDKHWVYFPEKKIIFFRVGFPHNFSSALVPPGKSSLYAEVSYSPDRPVNKKDLVKRILKDLRKVEILSAADTIEVCEPVDIEYAYIIYDRNYTESTKTIREYLNQHHIYPIGRYGRWKYMTMEDTILDGKKIAEVLQGDKIAQGCLREK